MKYIEAMSWIISAAGSVLATLFLLDLMGIHWLLQIKGWLHRVWYWATWSTWERAWQIDVAAND